MAERENLKSRSRRINPQVEAVGESLIKEMVKQGCANCVVLTEDMTLEEEDMAIFESFLKEGYIPEEAAQKAKNSHTLLRKVFKY